MKNNYTFVILAPTPTFVRMGARMTMDEGMTIPKSSFLTVQF